MSQTNCPCCGDLVRFPADLPEEAVVRCPLCREEFSFGQIAAKLPPMVEIVSLPEDVDRDEIGKFDALPTVAPAPSLVTGPRVNASVATRAARMRQSESPWRPLILLVEIALSGVVGIALAVLVLWWLPGQWHRDPLALKPVAAKYAPWLLPPAHRPSTDVDIEEGREPIAKTKVTKPPKSNAPSTESKSTTAKKPPVLGESKGGAGVASTDLSMDDAKEEPAKEEQPKQGESEPQKKPEKNWLEDLPPLEQEPPDLTWTTSPEVSALVRLGEKQKGKGAESNAAKEEFAATLRELARVAAQVNAEDVGVAAARTRYFKFLGELSEADWKLACEATAKAREKESIAPRGVVYLGKLKAALAEGSWLHLDMEPSPGDPGFPILIDPKLFHALGGDGLVGKEVFALASELPDPKRLIPDVPQGIKTTWLVGAIREASKGDGGEKASF